MIISKLTYGSYKINGLSRNCVKVFTSMPRFVGKVINMMTNQDVNVRDDYVLVVTKSD